MVMMTAHPQPSSSSSSKATKSTTPLDQNVKPSTLPLPDHLPQPNSTDLLTAISHIQSLIPLLDFRPPSNLNHQSLAHNFPPPESFQPGLSNLIPSLLLPLNPTRPNLNRSQDTLAMAMGLPNVTLSDHQEAIKRYRLSVDHALRLSEELVRRCTDMNGAGMALLLAEKIMARGEGRVVGEGKERPSNLTGGDGSDQQRQDGRGGDDESERLLRVRKRRRALLEQERGLTPSQVCGNGNGMGYGTAFGEVGFNAHSDGPSSSQVGYQGVGGGGGVPMTNQPSLALQRKQPFDPTLNTTTGNGDDQRRSPREAERVTLSEHVRKRYPDLTSMSEYMRFINSILLSSKSSSVGTLHHQPNRSLRDEKSLTDWKVRARLERFQDRCRGRSSSTQLEQVASSSSSSHGVIQVEVRNTCRTFVSFTATQDQQGDGRWRMIVSKVNALSPQEMDIDEVEKSNAGTSRSYSSSRYPYFRDLSNRFLTRAMERQSSSPRVSSNADGEGGEKGPTTSTAVVRKGDEEREEEDDPFFNLTQTLMDVSQLGGLSPLSLPMNW
ncbi:hypothetical protein IE53DRAFT_380900 [Violaceomyces palustris]|uniref:Uncharacterized protein n=1 Tax=Violaceomyces palustris TaxID=1673888 RepID=A0ACD0NT23_9BASI|nr:hypothetical protein IE53DRAFT_380900 [Violaceomyces palustris]